MRKFPVLLLCLVCSVAATALHAGDEKPDEGAVLAQVPPCVLGICYTAEQCALDLGCSATACKTVLDSLASDGAIHACNPGTGFCTLPPKAIRFGKTFSGADYNGFTITGRLLSSTAVAGFDPTQEIEVYSTATASPAWPALVCKEGEMSPTEWSDCITLPVASCVTVTGQIWGNQRDGYSLKLRSVDLATKCSPLP